MTSIALVMSVEVDSLDLFLVVCCLEEEVLDVLTLSIAEPSTRLKSNVKTRIVIILPLRKVEFMSLAFGVLKIERFSANWALK